MSNISLQEEHSTVADHIHVLSCCREELTKVVYFVKAGGVLIAPSVYALQAPSLAALKIDFDAADGSTYSLATDVMNATFTTDITSTSTSTVMREAEAFQVTIKQRISKSSFSEFQSKLQVEIRKGEESHSI